MMVQNQFATAAPQVEIVLVGTETFTAEFINSHAQLWPGLKSTHD